MTDTAARRAERSAATARSTLAGGVQVIGATLLLAFGDALAKLLAEDHSPAQIVWARFVFFLLPMVLILRPWRSFGLFRRHRPGLQILRGALAVASAACMIVGLQHIPLGDATAILFTAPSMVALLSVVLLGQPVRGYAVLALVIGFTGVLVIVRPGGGVLNGYALLPLATAFFFALYQIVTVVLGRAAPPLVTLFYTGSVAAALCSVIVPFSWTPPTATGWLLLVCCGLVHGSAHTNGQKS